MKVLQIAHSCPYMQPGGAQQVALNLFEALGNLDEKNEHFMLCAVEPSNHWLMDSSSSLLQTFKENHFHLRASSTPYPYHFSHNDSAFEALDNFIKNQGIDVVHFHHFINIGLDTIKRLINSNVNVKFGLTLHEYLTICGRDGQMLSSEGVNCSSINTSQCQKCLKWKKLDLDNREILMIDLLQSLHFLIAPSNFLINKIETTFNSLAKQIRMIDNPVRTKPLPRVPKVSWKQNKVKFGFFAASSATKGSELLYSAIRDLADDKEFDGRYEFHFYGEANINSAQSEEFPDAINIHGKYSNTDLDSILETLDFIVMGSIWWENSPLVIQEAANCDLGFVIPLGTAMHEKSEVFQNVFTYEIRNIKSLTATLKQVINLEPWELDQNSNHQKVKASSEKALTDHLLTYNEVSVVRPSP